MKSEFLAGLGLTEEQIRQIQQQAGADTQAARDSEKSKYESQIAQYQGQVTDLQGQLTQRDTDLTGLQTLLEAAQADAGKLTEAQQQLTALQTKYDNDSKAWEAKTAKQKRKYAIEAKAAALKFSSASAKRAFLHDAEKAATIKLDGDDLLNYSEFVEQYRAADPGAFIQDKKEPDPQPQPQPQPQPTPQPQPQIVLPGKSTPPKKKMSLSEMMKAKNANPNLRIDWD